LSGSRLRGILGEDRVAVKSFRRLAIRKRFQALVEAI